MTAAMPRQELPFDPNVAFLALRRSNEASEMWTWLDQQRHSWSAARFAAHDRRATGTLGCQDRRTPQSAPYPQSLSKKAGFCVATRVE